ncbi:MULTISPECIES: FG-GAP repeat domain-containing protein [Streptomyces]|uniref:VCBS repeat-containing protein n=2 Tax=Streptomyces TaxID=1883 RepID=A0ABU4JZB9_9ACTN|nr:VCBS repeat-containing protein [Streptomyces roseolus]MDX2290842.1 VCBS repeat-containing protein [Streptomyces roseolus]
MKHLSPAGRRLTVAVTVALAVTAGTAATAAPSFAAPAVPVAAAVSEQEAEPAVIGVGERLLSSGQAGYLTYAYVDEKSIYRWHRYADGSSVVLPVTMVPGNHEAAAVGDRVLLQTQKTSYRILDMAGGAPVDIDTSAAGTGAEVWVFTGDTLVMRKHDGDGRSSLHFFSKPAGTVVHRTTTGLPADAAVNRIVYSPSGVVAVQYDGTVGGTKGSRLAVVDLATAKVAEDRAVPAFYPNSDIAVTSTHLAWSERGPDGTVTLVTALRGAQESTRHTTLTPNGSAVTLGLLKDWLVYGVPGRVDTSAVSLKDGTTAGALLGSAGRLMPGAGDGLLAQGSTPEHGRGVYGIGLAPDGRPAATVLATNGVTTPTTVLTEQVPATADFRRAGAKAVLRWTYGRSDVQASVTMTHRKTGRSWYASRQLLGADTEAVFEWEGIFGERTAAYNGDYTWKTTVRPLNGVGGTVERTGTLRVDSGTAAHDYSDSASPDLLVRDSTGHLVSYDVRQFLATPWEDWERTERGGGWGVYDRMLSAGNLDASPYSDVVARDRSGVLWLYSGTGHSLATRVQVGGGWGVYDKLAAGSDLTGDGRPDLVATDRSGVLWLYKATGDRTKPFAPRKRIGGGWNTYDNLTAPGNLGGANAGDLLARDRSGVLWLYLGKGDGTFAPRTKVGGGWGRYEQIVNIGDVDRDGRADLIAESGTQQDPWLTVYKGTGDWKAPFGRAETIGIPPYDSPYGTRPVVF